MRPAAQLIQALAVTSLAVLLIIGYSSAAFASLQTIYVSPAGDDRTGNGNKSAPYQSVARAIAVASPDATIILTPGTYRTTIEVDKTLTIESDSDAPNAMTTTVVDATGRSHGVWIHGDSAAGSVVRGLTVRNPDDGGIVVADTSDVLIENNRVTNNALHPRAPRYDISGQASRVGIAGEPTVRRQPSPTCRTGF